MIETEKGKRMDQILATGITREQLAEALWCAERDKTLWQECAEARDKELEDLRAKVRRQAEELTLVRKALERANPDIKLYKGQCARLAEDNGKLREFAQGMYGILHRVYLQPIGLYAHGGVKPSDMLSINDSMHKLDLL